MVYAQSIHDAPPVTHNLILSRSLRARS